MTNIIFTGNYVTQLGQYLNRTFGSGKNSNYESKYVSHVSNDIYINDKEIIFSYASSFRKIIRHEYMSSKFESVLIDQSAIKLNIDEIYHYINTYKILGYQYIIICLNDIENSDINYNESIIKQMIEEINEIAKILEFPNIVIIPISLKNNDNISKLSDKMLWYTGYNISSNIHIYTLLDALEHYTILTDNLSDKSMHAFISGIYYIKSCGIVYAAEIITGTLKTGDNIKLFPSNVTGCIKTLEYFHKSTGQVKASNCCAFTLDNCNCNIDKTNFRTFELSTMTHLDNHNSKITNTIKLHLICIKPIKINSETPLILYHEYKKYNAHIEKINWKKDRKYKTDTPEYLEINDEAEVILTTTKPLCINNIEDTKLNRIIISCNETMMVMLGKIIL